MPLTTVETPSKGMQFKKPTASAPEPSGLSDAESMLKSIGSIDYSDKGFSDDDMKYAVAAKIAQDRLSGYDDVDDKRLKQEIDSIYENDLGMGEGAGAAMRGENLLTQGIDAANEGIDFVTHGIGGGADWLFDNTVGNLAGIFSEDAKNTVQNAFNGDDLAILADLGIDAALLAAGPVGWGLAAGKNAIQQADNLTEAFSGRDNVTLENLNEWERLGKGATGLGSIAASVIPGGAMAKGLGKAASKSNDVVKAATKLQKAQERMAKAAAKGPVTARRQKNVAKLQSNLDDVEAKALDRAVKNGTLEGNVATPADYLKNELAGRKAALTDFKDAVKRGSKDDRDAAKNLVYEARKNLRDAGRKADNRDALKTELDIAKAAKRETGIDPMRALRSLRDAAGPGSNVQARMVANAAKDAELKKAGGIIPPWLRKAGNFASNGAMNFGVATPASIMAETGANPMEALQMEMGLFNPEMENNMLPAAVAASLKPGSRKLLSNISHGRTAGDAVAAAALADAIGRRTENSAISGTGEEDVLAALRLGAANG